MIIEPGKVSQYGSTLAAGAAGVAGAAGLSGIGISTAKATSKNENEKSKYDVSNNGSLANPMDFPKGTHPDLEKLFEDPQSIPIIPGVTKVTSKKPKESVSWKFESIKIIIKINNNKKGKQ